MKSLIHANLISELKNNICYIYLYILNKQSKLPKTWHMFFALESFIRWNAYFTVLAVYVLESCVEIAVAVVYVENSVAWEGIKADEEW